MSSSMTRVVNGGALDSQKNLAEQAEKLRNSRRAERDAHDAAMRNAEDNSADLANIMYKLRKEKDSLEKEVEYYKSLLTKDFKEIAGIVGGTFLENYYEQQTLLSDWMVSQRAFKELAIKYGLEAGKTKEEVVAERKSTEEKVLNNETEHGNNFDRDDWEIFYAPRVKAKKNMK